MNEPLQFNSLRKRTMRLLLAPLMMIFIGIGVSAARDGQAQELLRQHVTVDVQDKPIRYVMQQVEKQARVKFVFLSNMIPAHQTVRLKAIDEPLETVLNSLLKPIGLAYDVEGRQIVLSRAAAGEAKPQPAPEPSGQQLTQPADISVTGTVMDETGSGLPGVSVLVKGTQRGTTTNADGKFTFSVPGPASVLIFSFVGYVPQEMALGNRTTLSVKLVPENKSLNEVVVLGYSSKNQTQLSSSVSVVDAQKLKGVTSPSLGNLLQGRASGVMVASTTGQPGADPAIRIRGTGTISAGANPLYVVDGVIGGTANPNDIESVTILKDAAATGLYGSRASNGVIVITTKSGKAGKTRVNINSSYGLSTISQGNFRMMNTEEYYNLTRPIYVNDYTGKRNGFVAELARTTPNPTDAQIAAYLKTKSLPATLDDYLAINFPASLLNYDTDWSDLVYRTGRTQNHEVSVAGGDEKTKFYIGGNFFDEQGTITTSAYKRYNIRMNLEHQINKKIRVIGRLNGRMDNTTFDYSGERGGAFTTYYNLPTDRPYNDDGSIRIGTEADWFGRDRFNFLFPMQYNYNVARSNNIQGDLVLNYDINNWLSFSTTNRVGLGNERVEIYDDPRTLTGGIRKGLLRNNIAYNQSLLNSNLLKASNNIGRHGISGLLGAEFQSNYGDFTNSSGGGVPTGLNVMDVSATPVAIGGSKYRNGFNSYFSQADYSYDNRYFATGSFRRDGSSKFGENNRYGNFWALGGSWIVSNESFFQKAGPLSLLKVRGSYGTTGNANITDFITQSLYRYAAQYNGISGAIPARLANPELTWEKAYTTNFGLNIGFFNRIELSVDAYQRDTKDLLFDVPLSSAAGFKTQIQNIGQIRNKGVDIELNTTNITTKNLIWRSNFNIGFNRNRVVALYQGQDIDLGSQRIIVGQPLGTWYMQKWLGVNPDNGAPLWEKVTYDGAGDVAKREATSNYNEATRQIMGGSLPKFTGGFTNNLSYKGLTLDVFVTFVSGALINHVLKENLGADGAFPTTNSVALRPGESRWEKPGDMATHPFPILGGNLNSNKLSSRYLEDGSYIRLRNVRLNYELPNALTQRLKLANINVFVTGDNLLTWTKFSGMDPEIGLDNATAGLSSYFISKKILFGLNIGL